jgi:hypothetical protein
MKGLMRMEDRGLEPLTSIFETYESQGLKASAQKPLAHSLAREVEKDS